MGGTARGVAVAVGFAATIGVASVAASAQGAEFAPERVVRVVSGSSESTSGPYAYFSAIAQAVNRHATNVRITVTETKGADDQLERLKKGQIQMGLGAGAVSYQAYNGLGKFQGDARRDLRQLWTYVQYIISFVVRADSDVKSLADLNGKRYSPGFVGSSTERITQEVLALLDIKPEYVRGGLEEALDLVRSREIVGLTKAGQGMIADSSILQLQATIPIRVLSFTPDQAEVVQKKYPQYGIRRFPAGKHGYPEDVVTISFTGDVITTSALPEAAAYQIVKAAWKARDLQRAAMSALSEDYLKVTLENSVLPLHAGAVRFYREMGYDVPARLIPPELK